MESLLYKTKCEWPISNAGGADRLTFTRSQVSRRHWAPVFPNGDTLCSYDFMYQGKRGNFKS